MKISVVLQKIYRLFYTKLFYTNRFNHIGRRSFICHPMQLEDLKAVSLGSHTSVAHYAWLIGNESMNDVTLQIGNYVQIGHLAHIVAKKKVIIEDYVLIADKVYISDCGHSYQEIHMPILAQGNYIVGEVVIGEGSWLGENVCVIGAKIGKHCVIGSNAVVTRNIPDYSVAVGIPARVIKRYNFSTGVWEDLE